VYRVAGFPLASDLEAGLAKAQRSPLMMASSSSERTRKRIFTMPSTADVCDRTHMQTEAAHEVLTAP
jgi:hypothetical protein